MPIFEYVCDTCGTAFEKLVRSAAATVECPACRGAHVTKQFSAFAFRGSGGFVSSMAGGCHSCGSGG